jgi:hypothetical protein
LVPIISPARSQTYLGATSVKPMGRPLLPAKPGTLMAGVCKAVQSEQKCGEPVHSSPSGASPGTEGVMRTLYLPAISSILGLKVAISSWICTSLCLVVPRPFSAQLVTCGSSFSFPIMYSRRIFTSASASVNSAILPFGPARFSKSGPRSTSSTCAPALERRSCAWIHIFFRSSEANESHWSVLTNPNEHSEIDFGDSDGDAVGSMMLKTREMSWISDIDLAKNPIVSKLIAHILLPSRHIVPNLPSQLDLCRYELITNVGLIP